MCTPFSIATWVSCWHLTVIYPLQWLASVSVGCSFLRVSVVLDLQVCILYLHLQWTGPSQRKRMGPVECCPVDPSFFFGLPVSPYVSLAFQA